MGANVSTTDSSWESKAIEKTVSSSKPLLSGFKSPRNIKKSSANNNNSNEMPFEFDPNDPRSPKMGRTPMSMLKKRKAEEISEVESENFVASTNGNSVESSTRQRISKRIKSEPQLSNDQSLILSPIQSKPIISESFESKTVVLNNENNKENSTPSKSAQQPQPPSPTMVVTATKLILLAAAVQSPNKKTPLKSRHRRFHSTGKFDKNAPKPITQSPSKMLLRAEAKQLGNANLDHDEVMQVMNSSSSNKDWKAISNQQMPFSPSGKRHIVFNH